MGNTRPIEWFTAVCGAVMAVSVIGAGALWLTGSVTGPINTKLDMFSSQLDQMQRQIAMFPRSDQVAAVDAHAHALDGRMDAIETRLRGDEVDIATSKQRLQSIEDSSRAPIGGRR